MGRGIEAALTALGARGAGVRWALDLATLDLSSVFGGALTGEASIEVASDEALAFSRPPEMAALGSLWVPGLESGEALSVAICEAHESLRARLDNDLETLARLGIDARLAAPVARARGTLQVGDDDVAVEIDPSGELVVTHVGSALVQAGQGRALGAPEDTEADEALVRITRVVQRVRERGLFGQAAADDDAGIDVDVDVDVDMGEAAPVAPSEGSWSEDEHTHAVGEASQRPDTQHLSDEQLAAVQDALSDESSEAPDLSDEAEPIVDDDDEHAVTARLAIHATAADAAPLPQPMVADNEDDIRTVSISLRHQSSLLRALDALGKQPDAPAPTTGIPPVPSTGHSDEPEDGTQGDRSNIEDQTLNLAAPPPVSMASMPDLPPGSDDREAQPTVVLPSSPRGSGEDAAAMPPPTASVPPVNARLPSDEIESIARGFDEGDDLDESAVAPVPSPDNVGEETAGYQFGRPPVQATLDDAPPATNATVSHPAEPPVPAASMEEPSDEEPGVEQEPAGAPAVATSLALLPPDEPTALPPDPALHAGGFDGSDDDDQRIEAPPLGAPPAAADGDALAPADTTSIKLPESAHGTVDARPPAAPLEVSPPIEADDGDDEPRTRQFAPSDLLGLIRRTAEPDDAALDPAVLEARADALEAEARELRMRAGALRARQLAVTVVPPAGIDAGLASELSDAPPLPPPPMLVRDDSASGTSLPMLPSMEVHAVEASQTSTSDETKAPASAPAAQVHDSVEEGVSLAEVRAALGVPAGESTQVGVMASPAELREQFPSADSDVFADATAALPPSQGVGATSVRRAIALVVEDARARDRLKRHLLPRFDELLEAADASSAVELPNLAHLDALVFVRPRPDAKTRHGLSHLEGMSRRPRVLIISSDEAFDQMPSVDHRLPLGNRASEVAQQVIDGLTALGVTPLEA